MKLSHGVLCSAAFLPAVAFAAASSSASPLPPLRCPSASAALACSAAASGLFLLSFNSRGALSTLVILPLMAATCQPLISGSNGSGYGSGSSSGSSSGSGTGSDSANDTETDSLRLCSFCSHSFIRGHGTYTHCTHTDAAG